MLKIYKASAGSGKTFTLTREYIKFLIARKGEDGRYRLRRRPAGVHRNILAITYTNKATEEMTRRIIHELAVLACLPVAAGKKSPYRDEFLSELGCTSDELAESARTALYDLLCDYNYFNVSTIDAFFQSVLRIFTREVEVPDNFDVELDNNYTISLGVSEMFNSINYREPTDPVRRKEHQWLTHWLTCYMKSLMDSGKVFNLFSKASYIHNDIVGTFASLMDETFKMHLQEMQEYFSDRLRIMRFDAGMTAGINSLFERLRQQAVRVSQLTDPSTLYVHLKNPMLKWIDGEMYIPGGSTVAEAVTNEKKRFCAAYLKKGPSAEVDDAVTEMCRTAVELMERHETYSCIQSTVYQLGLMGALISYIDQYCRDNNLLLLSETNSLLREIINDDETPFIYEKLGYYLDHFLIDEFQDTSPMQWDNLRPLVMESLSRGCDNLVIGDEKQCIYRFRNSDPELLSRHVGHQISTRYPEGGVEVRGVDISDNNNWRSAVEIVTFNNSLFHSLAAVVDGGGKAGSDTISAAATYSNIIQQIPEARSGRHGYVKLHFAPTKEELQAADENGKNDRAAIEYALRFMTGEIRRQLTAGGYSPRDIAVLVRSHTHGEEVINHLLREMDRPGSGLPRFEIMSSDAMTVGSSPTVRLIISILRLVNTPEFLDPEKRDETHSGTEPPTHRVNPAHRRARLINRYEYYLHMTRTDTPDGTPRPYTSTEALIAALDDVDSADSGDTGKESESFRSVLAMSCPNLPSIVERIISRYIPAGACADDNIFITAFQDTVLDYCSRGDHDIRAFLAWWDKTGYRTALSSPPDMNALTVMTIHQSKGLEFPCVHIPFATGDLMKYTGYSWHSLDGRLFPGIAAGDVPPIVPLPVTPRLADIPMFRDEFTDYTRRQRIDELNVNYVAFTRATTELIVCTDTDPGKSGERFGPYLKSAIERMTADYIAGDACPLDNGRRRWVMPVSEYFDGQTLVIGMPTVKDTDKKPDSKPDSLAPEKLPMPAYRSYDNVQVTGRTRTETLETFDITSPRHLGNFLHDVMSSVRHAGDLDTAMERQAYRYGLTESDRRRQHDKLARAIGSEDAAGWFDGYIRVITERSVSADETVRRPDRIVWTADGTVDIIDYKFGETPPADESGKESRQHRGYVRQVKEYARMLRAAGHTGVRGFLWYITDSHSQAIRIV